MFEVGEQHETIGRTLELDVRSFPFSLFPLMKFSRGFRQQEGLHQTDHAATRTLIRWTWRNRAVAEGESRGFVVRSRRCETLFKIAATKPPFFWLVAGGGEHRALAPCVGV